jgi:hypothetical protein
LLVARQAVLGSVEIAGTLVAPGITEGQPVWILPFWILVTDADVIGLVLTLLDIDLADTDVDLGPTAPKCSLVDEITDTVVSVALALPRFLRPLADASFAHNLYII